MMWDTQSRITRRCLVGFVAVSLCGWAGQSMAAAPPDSAGWVAIEQAFDAAKTNYEANPGNAEAAWKFARACFDKADNEEKDSVRATVAWQGVHACQELLKQHPNLAEAHYYLGMDLGEVARTKRLSALHLLREMEKEWQTTIALDEHCDFGGPNRNLGLLYRDAPGSPLSIGSRAKAREHIRRAVELDPEYPENHINLIESDLKWGDTADALTEEKKWLALLPEERKQFSGLEWRLDWLDWNQRAAKIWKRLGPKMGGRRF